MSNRQNRSQLAAGAKKYYDKLKRKSVMSPALNSNVFFTNKGWGHIVHSQRREFNDVYRRLKLLHYAKDILRRIRTFSVRDERGMTFYTVSGSRTMKINGHEIKKKISVVLIKPAPLNRYTFLSISDR